MAAKASAFMSLSVCALAGARQTTKSDCERSARQRHLLAHRLPRDRLRIVDEQAHAEGLRQLAQVAADRAEADDAQRALGGLALPPWSCDLRREDDEDDRDDDAAAMGTSRLPSLPAPALLGCRNAARCAVSGEGRARSAPRNRTTRCPAAPSAFGNTMKPSRSACSTLPSARTPMGSPLRHRVEGGPLAHELVFLVQPVGHADQPQQRWRAPAARRCGSGAIMPSRRSADRIAR